MRCPNCASLDTQVKDSRPTEDSSVIRRRRVCLSCNFRFRQDVRDLTCLLFNFEGDLIIADRRGQTGSA